MKSWRLPFLALGFLSLFGKACAVKSSEEAIPADWEQANYIERGNYLVNYLGHCVGCHTPLGPDGRSDMSLYLSGVPAKFAGAKAGPPPGRRLPRTAWLSGLCKKHYARSRNGDWSLDRRSVRADIRNRGKAGWPEVSHFTDGVEHLRQHERRRCSRHLPLSSNDQSDTEQSSGEYSTAIAVCLMKATPALSKGNRRPRSRESRPSSMSLVPNSRRREPPSRAISWTSVLSRNWIARDLSIGSTSRHSIVGSKPRSAVQKA